MTTAALNNLWAYINGLTLTANERQWLAGKLTDDVINQEVDGKNEKAVKQLPESFKRLRGMGRVTPDDIANDDRLAYILSK